MPEIQVLTGKIQVQDLSFVHFIIIIIIKEEEEEDSCVGLNENGPIGSYICKAGPQ